MANHQTNTVMNEFSSITDVEWADTVRQFDDATIYQTIPYGKVKWGEDKLSHFIIRKNGDILAVAQIALFHVPCLTFGIAYIYRGPLWRKSGKKIELSHFREIIHALKVELVVQRKLCIIISCNEFNEDNQIIESILIEEGYKPLKSAPNYRTFLIDLSPSLEQLRKGMDKKWRAHLRKAEQNSLKIYEGTGEDLYDTFIKLYKEMYKRKRFAEFVDIRAFRKIEKYLNESSKMRIMICEYKNDPVSGLIWSVIGDTGVPIFSATADRGLRLNSSYLLRWQLLVNLKQNGYRFLDQGGINPRLNPGGYSFKKGMGGKDIKLIGQYCLCNNKLNYLLLDIGYSLKTKYKFLKRYFCKIGSTVICVKIVN
jgi:lipid II:glycine glycyltransferase (peptidoglycan interpeptide bridge formation enzyme)